MRQSKVKLRRFEARGAVCSAEMEVAAGALINSHHGMDNAHKMDLAGRVGSALPDIDSLRTS